MSFRSKPLGRLNSDVSFVPLESRPFEKVNLVSSQSGKERKAENLEKLWLLLLQLPDRGFDQLVSIEGPLILLASLITTRASTISLHRSHRTSP
jgi:hypothetical protein